MYNKKPNETTCSPLKKNLRSSTDLSNFDWEKTVSFMGKKLIKKKRQNWNRRRQISCINTPTLNHFTVNFMTVQKNDYYLEIHKRISGIADLQTLQAKYLAEWYNLLKNLIHLSNVEKKDGPRILMMDAAMEQMYLYST